MLLLKYLSKTIEDKFKEWAKNWASEYFKTKRGFEGKGFEIMVRFFLSDIGQDAFKKWLVEDTQKNPLE